MRKASKIGILAAFIVIISIVLAFLSRTSAIPVRDVTVIENGNVMVEYLNYSVLLPYEGIPGPSCGFCTFKTMNFSLPYNGFVLISAKDGSGADILNSSGISILNSSGREVFWSGLPYCRLYGTYALPLLAGNYTVQLPDYQNGASQEFLTFKYFGFRNSSVSNSEYNISSRPYYTGYRYVNMSLPSSGHVAISYWLSGINQSYFNSSTLSSYFQVRFLNETNNLYNSSCGYEGAWAGYFLMGLKGRNGSYTDATPTLLFPVAAGNMSLRIRSSYYGNVTMHFNITYVQNEQ